MAIPPKNSLFIYRSSLIADARYQQKLKNGVYALVDYGSNNRPVKTLRFVILTRQNGSLICNCGMDNCLHLQAATLKWPNDTNADNNDIHPTVWSLETPKYFGVYCTVSKSYSIVEQRANTAKCLTCKSISGVSTNSKCSHVKAYERRYLPKYKSPEFPCISSIPIPFDFEGNDKQMYNNPPPEHLIPEYSPTNVCDHQNKFDARCPIENEWIVKSRKRPRVHEAKKSIDCTLYYRPTLGSCNCTQSYDGRHNHLLNLDNRNFFTYAWLFDYLFFTQETRLPLAAYFRVINRSRNQGPEEQLKSYMEDLLRKAYNSFIRLLDLDYKDLYKCNICKDNVKGIVIDGLQMGCLENKMPIKPNRPNNLNVIEELPNERVYLKAPATRKMLAEYAGYSKGKYTPPKELPFVKFHALLMRLEQESPRLRKVIKKAGSTCPLKIQKLAGELSRGNPTAGLFQIAGEIGEVDTAFKVLKEIAKGNYTFLVTYRDILDKTCPLLIDLIEEGRDSNRYVLKLLDHLLDHIKAPYNTAIPHDHQYEPPAAYNDILEEFPNHDQIRGKGTYGADSNPDTPADCKKSTKKASNLTSGLFLFFVNMEYVLGFKLWMHQKVLGYHLIY